MQARNPESQRIVIVSNRLPFTVIQEGEGIQFNESVGGVATGLRTLLTSAQSSLSRESELVWVGWPGSTIRDEIRDEVRSKALADYNCCPVFLTEQDLENFYQGFCNETIWPLFHYFLSFTEFREEDFANYQEVNRAFCNKILSFAEPGDTVWIHDYHLMLLPGMLRERQPDITIGFFLHIPFPSFEMFRVLHLDWKQKIIEGLLGADLIAFQTIKENVLLAQEVYDVIQLQYRAGIKAYLEVITAETDLRTAQINYFISLYLLLSSKIDVERALGNIQY